MEKLYVIIPAYNEGMNIEQCIDDWYPIVERHNGNGESRLVIINDGSKDNTYEIMQKLAKDKPLFTPLTKANGGHGDTVLYGYRYAIRHDADYIFQTDSDGQTVPEEFWKFWRERRLCGLLIGERKRRQEDIFLVKLGFYFAGACAIILLLEVCPQDFLRFPWGNRERER